MRRRFSREAKSAAAVVHPHVVPIQTVDEHNGLPYLVMPVVEGRSLQQRVDADGPLEIVEVVRIAAQVAEGLAAAHEQGLVHRDIKPANILLENGVERVQITDFGLARAADDASITRSGVIAGTPQYMSPEQAHGDDIDHRSDLFSLGSVMYFMLTGRSPFRAETTMGVLNRIGNDQPRELRSINSEIPPWLSSIVQRLLEKNPNNRYASAEAVAKELGARLIDLQDATITTTNRRTLSSGNWPPLGRLATIAGGAAIFALLAGLFLIQTDQGTIRIETNEDVTVPIRIRQGNEIVQRLTVDSDGASIRVRAGSYLVEVEGDDPSVEIRNNKAVVKAAAVWVARIELISPGSDSEDHENWKSTKDPATVRDLARDDAEHGRYEEALEKTLWNWDNAVTIQPSWSAVRRSFLLSSWLELGEAYPPALDKLRSVRDELQARVLSTEQVRVRSDDFADFAAINETLREDERTLEVYEKIQARDPKDAKRLRFYLPSKDEDAKAATPDETSANPEASSEHEKSKHDGAASSLDRSDTATLFATPQATLEFLHRSSLADPPTFAAECYTEEAVLEISGTMLQSLMFMSVLSQVGAQSGGIVGETEGVPIVAPVSFKLQVDVLMKEQSLAEPPEVATEALQMLVQATVNQAFGKNQTALTPDRMMVRLAAGVLKSPKEFIPAASQLLESFGLDGDEQAQPNPKPTTAPKWVIEVDGDTATATQIDEGNETDDGSRTISPPMKLRRLDGTWKISQIFSDEDFRQMQTSYSGVMGVEEATDATKNQ